MQYISFMVRNGILSSLVTIIEI